ncbi:MAG: restriction endonuclease [Promethearchaeota archaeon]
MPIDFSNITGEEFELFCRDLLESLGLDIIEGPARGSDRKKDMIIRYTQKDKIGRIQDYILLVQCKNKSKSQKSVYEKDLGDIRSACKLHNTNGYFLISSTVPSTSAQDILRAIDEEGQYFTHYWDQYQIERYLSSCDDNIDILERFGLIKSKNKIFGYMGLVPEEYDFMQELNENRPNYAKIRLFQDSEQQISEPNTCFISHGNIINLFIDNEPLDGDIIERIKTLNYLEHLELNSQNLNYIPKSIFQLKYLENLYLPNNKIKKIPIKINSLSNLVDFDISNNPIEEIEVDVNFFKKLKHFWIDSTQIPVFEELFKELKYQKCVLNSKTIEIHGFSQEDVDKFFQEL